MIEQIAVGGFDDNFSYVVHDGESAAIVDPSGDIEKVFARIEEKELNIVAILITHSHADHSDKLGECLERFDVPVYVHENGVGRIDVEEKRIRPVNEGDVIAIGDLNVRVLHTPGHIDDAVCFYIDETAAGNGVPKLITGDTLFVEGCGRVFAEEDARTIYDSLQRLAKLSDETEIFPGHDYGSKPASTMQWEKEHNRFYLAEDFAAFKKERLG